MNITYLSQILGIVWIIRHSSLLEWLRKATEKYTLPQQFFNCPFCAAFWAKVGLDIGPALAHGTIPATPDIITTVWNGVGIGFISLLAFTVYDYLKTEVTKKGG